MNIIESNKLLASFMGAKNRTQVVFPIDNNEIWIPKHGICRSNTVSLGKGRTIRYHNLWDWLMPVVEKIYSIAKEWDFESDEYSKFEEIFDIDHTINDFLNNDIEQIYGRCVEFVNYYNTLNNDTTTNSRL